MARWVERLERRKARQEDAGEDRCIETYQQDEIVSRVWGREQRREEARYYE